MHKKRIALVIDVENWAFDIGAKLLKKKLKDYYEIEIFSSSKYNDDLFAILEDTKNFDMIHFFWRKLLIQFESNEFKSKLLENNLDYDKYIQDICPKISTSVYDHLFIDEENVNVYLPIFSKYSRRYYTSSKKLEKIYSNLNNYPKPWGTLQDTYDNTLYNGGDKSRFKNKEQNKLVIGWVGNSNWNIKKQDFKGFHSILEPVVNELIEEGYNIEKNYADRNVIFRTNDQMPEYYQSIDLCVVVSAVEGTPRPVIEAMASGVPIITTDVGIVGEVLGPKQKEFILGDRDNCKNDEIIKKRLKEKIIELYNNKEKLIELSEENYEYTKYNDIDHTYIDYKKYFDEFLGL